MRNLMLNSLFPDPSAARGRGRKSRCQHENTRISPAAAPQIRVDSPVMARFHQSLLTASAARTAIRGTIGADSLGLTATTIKTITKTIP
ncbi:hypothetical protein [Cupriavidus sp.]|uniref:hypothetical protein n=1 Tax=Cupriavidus sp. TaxID=1873897 RepID=UPI001113B0D4